jgi:hypothetical protein
MRPQAYKELQRRGGLTLLVLGQGRLTDPKNLPELRLSEVESSDFPYTDNGPEFRGRALAAWSEERGVRLEFI